MKERIEDILAGKAHEQAVIPVSALVFDPGLFQYCASNACGQYNKSWTCPPVSGTLEEHREKILSYKNAFVFTTKYDLEDSFDYEGMTAGRETHTALTVAVRDKLTKAALVYGAGSCPYCDSCAFPEPCSFPEKKICAIEAAGINVTDLSRSAGVRYNNGPNTVTYFSMILYNE
jgi:predicted metal-binding protein